MSILLWLVAGALVYWTGIVLAACISVKFFGLRADPEKWYAQDYLPMVFWPISLLCLLVLGITGSISYLFLASIKLAMPRQKPKVAPNGGFCRSDPNFVIEPVPIVLCDACRAKMPQKGPMS